MNNCCLKRVLAITMLSVYLFNLAGYPLLFNFLADRTNTALVAKLDESIYDASALIEIKIPLYIPYITGNDQYERYDGQIESGGVKYNYVKRKIYGDTLYLLCLPDEQGTKLLAAKNEYGKNAADIPAGKKEKNVTAKKGGLPVLYNNRELAFSFSAGTAAIEQEPAYLITALPHSVISKQEQPPDASSSAG